MSAGLVLLTGLLAAAPVLSSGWSPHRSALAEVPTLPMPAVDRAALLDEDAERARRGVTPLRFATVHETSLTPVDSGRWERLTGGAAVWRLAVESSGASSLSLALRDLVLPEDATLWLSGVAEGDTRGPFSPGDRSPSGELWTPMVRGDVALLELHLPHGDPEAASLEVFRVHHGYRELPGSPVTPLGAATCNNDTVCPEADPWRKQVRATVRLSVAGIWLCSGTLVNSGSGSFVPYLLTARHCHVRWHNADSVVAYWNYESSTCGMLEGGTLDDSLSGTWFVAFHNSTDVALLRLLDQPPPAFEAYYSGWDVSGVAPQSAVGVHHPGGGVKAISYEDNPPESVSTPPSLGVPRLPDSHWRAAWESGTTEGGSSGSCLWNEERMCVGKLSTGIGGCASPTTDYGKLSVAWEGGGAPATRLRDWLDPDGSWGTLLEGSDGAVQLVGDWPLDDGQGSTAEDRVLGNDADIFGAMWTTGVGGAALGFDGTNDYATISSLSSYKQTQSMTVEVWVRVEPNQPPEGAVVLDKSRGLCCGDFTGYSIEASSADPDALAFLVGNGNSWTEVVAPRAMNDGIWHHVAGTVDAGDARARLYIDGTLVAEEPFVGPIGVNNRTVYLGRRGGGVGTNHLNGDVDEVRLRDRALGPAEIAAHYRRDATQSPGEVPDLLLDRDPSSGDVSLSFAPSRNAGSTAATYDTLRSERPDDFTSAICVESGDDDLWALDAAGATTGNAFYLVRARVAPLGPGPLGESSDGTPRSGADCP